MDIDEYRQASLERWERAAGGWAHGRAALQRLVMPVSDWMIAAIAPQPGEVVLELAAGPGDTGLLVAELIAPTGRLICSDFAEAMLDVARQRARELSIENVEFRALDAEALALETASVDAVLCRWGYMLLADPAAALSESQRVLRRGGRVSLAAWDAPERNPWVSLPSDEAQRRSGQPPAPIDLPGMFAFSPPGRIEALLSQAGFAEIEVAGLDLDMTYEGFDAWWAATLDLSRPFADLVDSLSAGAVADMRAAVQCASAEFTDSEHALHLPGRALVASATAST